MFGGEGQGLTADTLLAANRRLRIPIDSRVESLNVGAAAAVCLFEQKRRRRVRALARHRPFAIAERQVRRYPCSVHVPSARGQ